MIYTTSDFHAFHKSILNSREQFKSMPEMNIYIINNINNIVNDSDELYILGDVEKDAQYSEKCWFLSSLKGKKTIITGNHDANDGDRLMDDGIIVNYCDSCIVHYKGIEFVLTHRPVEVKKGQINIHGHLHSKKAKIDLQHYDCGIDANDYKPVSIEEIYKIMY